MASLSNLLVPLQDLNQARRTRAHNEMSLKVPSIKSTVGRKAFAYRGPLHWNRLPGFLKLITSFDSFVSEIKKRATSI